MKPLTLIGSYSNPISCHSFRGVSYFFIQYYYQFKMQEEQGINRQLFPSNNPFQRIDQSRVHYFKKKEVAENQEKPEEKMKKVINPNIFREDLRRQQRDFRQTNHEYLKMCGIISRASRDDNKFAYIGDSHRKANITSKGNTNSKNTQKKTAMVHLALDTTEFNCALLINKVPIKDLYNLFPFQKESISFQSHEYLNPDYIFFFYENENKVAQTLKKTLDGTIEEGILAEFKSSINKSFKHISYFDYLYFINPRPVVIKKQVNYPKDIIDIAKQNANFLAKIDEDDKSKFNREELSVHEQETCERLIMCEEGDVVDSGQNLCFQTIEEYSDYKKYKAVNFKNQKIFEKDAVINTNIRNIISTEKIYLVEIIEQVKSYIELSQECQGTGIMGKVYEQITSKADQYLRLLCGYTESKILTIYNIQNYQEKIYTFIQKSIRYKKEIRNLPRQVIKQFPVLEIWFSLPQNLLGYSRHELHETFYQLMEAIIIFEDKIKANEFYKSLKTKRPGVKYA